MSTSSSDASPRVVLSSHGRGWSAVQAALLHVPRGIGSAPAVGVHLLGMHLGPPVVADYRCDGRRVRRVQKAGDIYTLPAGLDGTWEDDGDCRILQLQMAPDRLAEVAEELGRGGEQLVQRFGVRDPGLEAIGCAIKADLEAASPSDPLYIDHLARALAVRLIEVASRDSTVAVEKRVRQLPARRLRSLTEYIEGNLDRPLRLDELARVAELSVTHLKTLFRNSTGVPVHQYVLRRRVERARSLLTTTALPMSEIASAAGFAHQSHMASTMRRMLGQTPREIARQAG